jgi:hypothetical protein
MKKVIKLAPATQNPDTHAAAGLVDSNSTANAIPHATTAVSKPLGNPAEISAKAYARMADIGLIQKRVDELVAQINVQCLELTKDRNYTLKKICGYEIWSFKSKAQQIAAGLCLPILCEAGVVPLIDTGEKNSSNARLYRVK